MKRSSLLVIGATLLLAVILAATIRPSLASRESMQVESDSTVNSPAAAAAAAPVVFSYQGQLTNAAGNPITNATLPITFRLFTTLTGGTACWTEAQNVNVQNGQFNVLLGQVTVIPSACVTGNPYLEISVNGETLTPRELLTSVASAVQAQTLTDGAIARGNMAVEGVLTVNSQGTTYVAGNVLVGGNVTPRYAAMDGDDLVVDGTLEQVSGQGARVYRLGIGRDPGGGEGDMQVGNSVVIGNYLDMTQGDINSVNTINYSGTEIAKSGTSMRMISNGTSLRIFLDADNNEDGASFQVYRDAPNFNGSQRLIFDVDNNGNVFMNGSLTSPQNSNLIIDAGAGTSNTVEIMDGLLIHGDCQRVSGTGQYVSSERNGSPQGGCAAGSITSGAYIEANLMTAEERVTNRISRFEQGDLLCWSPNEHQLEKCAAANDPLVMGVADANGKPIVLGAEQIKVLGPVQAGDYLVASDVPGYAQASDAPSFGIVIGQALEDFDGERGFILAMIRKM